MFFPLKMLNNKEAKTSSHLSKWILAQTANMTVAESDWVESPGPETSTRNILLLKTQVLEYVQCARHCILYTSSHLIYLMTSRDRFYHHPHFKKWWKWGTERGKVWLKVTCLVSHGAGIPTHTFLTPKPDSDLLCPGSLGLDLWLQDPTSSLPSQA